jgi:hypothetical protein
VVFARGEGRTTSRVWPLFSQSQNKTLEDDSYLWPLYRHKEVHADPLEQTHNSILIYAYSAVTEKNTQTGAEKKRLDMWPFFTWHRDFSGNERLQIFAPVEPALPDNRGVERNWSPLWSLWRWEHNAKTGDSSQSLLWNLYRRDATPSAKKCSLLFGLFKYQSDAKETDFRLFGLMRYESDAKSNEWRLLHFIRYQSDENSKKLRVLHIPVFKEQKPAAQSGK